LREACRLAATGRPVNLLNDLASIARIDQGSPSLAPLMSSIFQLPASRTKS